MKNTNCPLCGKINELAQADGHTDGPREYHADCWAELDGDLMDYNTGESIRDATTDEAQASVLAAADDGGAGVILLLDGDLVDGSHRLADDARRCYVTS